MDLVPGCIFMVVVRRRLPLEKLSESSGAPRSLGFATLCVHTYSLSYHQETLKNLTRFTASGRLVFLMTLLQTLPQEVHDIDDLALLFGPWRAFRRFNGFGLTRLDLFVDQLQEILMIFVPIFLGIPRARHGIDQLFSHLELLF